MAWNVLQSAFAIAGTTSVTATFPNNAQAGTKIIAVVTAADPTSTTAVSSVQDAALNSWTQITPTASNASGAQLSIWALDTPAGDVGIKPAIKATFTVGDAVGITIIEVSGLLAGNTTAMADGTPGTLTGATASTGSPTYSSNAANELLIAGYGDNANNATVVKTSGAWTMAGSNTAGAGNSNCLLEYTNSTGGNETNGFTGADTTAWAIVEVAFKLGASGAASTSFSVPHRPGLSRLRHHQGARRQQVQVAFVPQTSAATANAGLATAAAAAQGPAAALGTVTGSTSVPGEAVAGLATPGAPEFPGTAVTVRLATGVGAAQPTAFNYAPAGVATAAGGAPLYATYTALYTATYGEQLTTVSTVPVANAPAQIATGAGVAQQTAGHNATVATGTGSAPASGMAQAQLASGAGTAQQTAGHNVTVASGAGSAQQPAGHNVTIATGIGDAPELGMGMAGLATAAGAARQTAGHNAQLATGSGSAQQPAGHEAQLATATGAALQPAVSTFTGPNKAIGVTVAATRITGIGNGKNTSTVPVVQSSMTGLKLTVNSGTRVTPGAAQTAGSMNALATTERNAADITTTDTSGSVNAAATTGEGGP